VTFIPDLRIQFVLIVNFHTRNHVIITGDVYIVRINIYSVISATIGILKIIYVLVLTKGNILVDLCYVKLVEEEVTMIVKKSFHSIEL
jgi:hypothetical protein